MFGAPEEIRTPDPLVRSQVLYPAELRAREACIILEVAFDSRRIKPKSNMNALKLGGERGIRTLDTDLSPYASLAGKCLRPLGQLSARGRNNT